jgi:hypothetical protein
MKAGVLSSTLFSKKYFTFTNKKSIRYPMNSNETLCEEVSFNKAYLSNVQAATNFTYHYKCGMRCCLDLVQDAFAKI